MAESPDGAKPKMGPGALAEDLARTFLEELGYRIMATDFRLGRWQVDILALDRSQPVVIEVKSRREPGRPEANLSPDQAARVLQAGAAFFKGKGGPPRLDLITVRFMRTGPPELDLFKDLQLFA